MNWETAHDRTIFLDRIQVMGILNVTPDSFSDGGKYFTPEAAVAHAVEMAQQGADIIDIGAQSTRPGYSRLTPQEEWSRIKKVIPAVREAVDVPLSIDTFYPEVALKAVMAGVNIINDVTGFDNEEMRRAAKVTNAGVVVTHHTEIDHGAPVAESIRAFFEKRVDELEGCGIQRDRICLDPGLGFGKNNEENVAAVANFETFCLDGCPMLIAASRKRFIGAACGGARPEERDFGTTAVDTAACLSGARIVRVHNIPAAVQAARLCDAMLMGR